MSEKMIGVFWIVEMESILPVSSFVDEPMRTDLDRWFRIREMTLEKCYAIPGFATVGRAGKNRIYDHVKNGIIAQMEGQK